MVVDSGLHMALAAVAALSQPSAVLFHTAAAFFKPSPFTAPFLAAINATRQAHGIASLTGFLELTEPIQVIVATLPELDDYNLQAPPIGTGSDQYPVLRKSRSMRRCSMEAITAHWC